MKIILNLKVNGVDFHKSSVLSIYIMFLNDNNEKIKTINRYYYPREKYNHPNIDRISTTENRKISTVEYPQYFDEDFEVRDMIVDPNVELIIGHNIMFDVSFISKSFKNFDEMGQKKYFCTMLYNAPLLQLPLENNVKHNGYFKFPSFKKTLIKYNIIKFDSDEYSSKFYVEAIKDIYKKTLENMDKKGILMIPEHEIINYYKSNLIDFVLSDDNFREIDININDGEILSYNQLTRKFKKIVDEYAVTPTMTINNIGNYSMHKLDELNKLINNHALEFTTKYPKFTL